MHTDVGPYRITAPIPAPGRADSDGLFLAEGVDGAVLLEVVDAVVGPGADPVAFTPTAEALVRLQHPALATPSAWGLDERRRVRWLMTPIVPTAPLGVVRSAANRALSPAETARLLLPVAEGLAAAHAHGVRHGALHPGRVCWRLPMPDAAHPVALGFRVASVRADTAYTAPERQDATGTARTPADDVYGLCALAWSLTARGAGPAGALRPLTEDERAGTRPLATGSGQPTWDDLLRHGLHPAPDRRLPSMDAVVRGLRAVARSHPPTDTLPTRLHRHLTELARQPAPTDRTPVTASPRDGFVPEPSGPVGLPAPQLLPRPPKKPSVPPNAVFRPDEPTRPMGPARPRSARQMFAALLGLRIDRDD
jgi:hypothetical protein